MLQSGGIRKERERERERERYGCKSIQSKIGQNIGHFIRSAKCLSREYLLVSPTPLTRAQSGCHGNEPRSSHSLISQKQAIKTKDGAVVSQFKLMTTVWYLHKMFWEELITYFTLIRHWPHGKRRLQQFSVALGTSLPNCYLATIDRYTDRPTDSPLIRHRPHRNDEFNNSSIDTYILCRENVFT
jgi:hypothetical protein